MGVGLRGIKSLGMLQGDDRFLTAALLRKNRAQVKISDAQIVS